MTKYRFVQLCASEEGFGIAGTVPTRDNNPMDLRHSPHSWHALNAPEAIGQIDSVEDGWADADRQAELWAERGLNLAKVIYTLAPPIENNTANYLEFVLAGLNKVSKFVPVTAGTSMQAVLLIPAEL